MDIVSDVDFKMLWMMVCRCLILYNLLDVMHHVCFFLGWTGRRMRMKGFPVRQKMTRDNWRRKPKRWEVREERKRGCLLQIPQNVFLTPCLSFFLSVSAGQICWGRRIQRSCLCWRRRCGSSGGCGRARTRARRPAGRSSLSSGQPAAWSRPGGRPSWRMPCRKVRQRKRVCVCVLQMHCLSSILNNQAEWTE